MKDLRLSQGRRGESGETAEELPAAQAQVHRPGPAEDRRRDDDDQVRPVQDGDRLGEAGG